MLPIVFLHLGESYGEHPYLEYTLCQVKKWNKHSPIILIGDQRNEIIAKRCEIIYVPFSIGKKSQEFLKNYKSLTTNHPKLEALCFLRWFVLNEFMEVNNIQRCWFGDTDVLYYENLSDEKFNDLTMTRLGSKGPFQGYISKNYLGLFTDFLLEKYSDNHFVNQVLVSRFEKWKRYLEGQGGEFIGPVSDMTLASFWCDENENKWQDLLQIKNNAVFNDNLRAAEENAGAQMRNFKSKNGKLRVVFIKDCPYVINRDDGNLVRLYNIHFQGDDQKPFIKIFYERPIGYNDEIFEFDFFEKKWEKKPMWECDENIGYQFLRAYKNGAIDILTATLAIKSIYKEKAKQLLTLLEKGVEND